MFNEFCCYNELYCFSRAKELINSIVQQRSRTEGTGGARMDDMNMGGGSVPNISHVSPTVTITPVLG